MSAYIDELALYRLLEAADIAYECFAHEPVFTVEESQKVDAILPEGQAIKNLFLKDRKQNFWLVSVRDTLRPDLKALSKVLGAKGGLSFANSDYLWQYLKVKPGSVNPFAILNNPNGEVSFFMDEILYRSSYFHGHPMRNDRTITTKTSQIVDLLRQNKVIVGRIDFAQDPPILLS